MLAYIYSNYSVAEDKDVLKELFTTAMKQWLSIRIAYVRACTATRKVKCLIHISETLNKIADMEENIANYIVEGDRSYISSYLKGHTDEVLNENILDKVKTKSVKILDLSKYFNNKAFGKFSNTENACFSISGEYMIKPSSDVTVKLCEKVISLPLAESMDNMICQNQRITLNLVNVKNIIVIGNKEFDYSDSNLTLEYQSGLKQNILLEFPEWYTEILENEVVIHESNVIQKNKNDIGVTSFKGKIFMKKYAISSTEQISSIIFLNSGRIHIFYILLVCEDGKSVVS